MFEKESNVSGKGKIMKLKRKKRKEKGNFLFEGRSGTEIQIDGVEYHESSSMEKVGHNSGEREKLDMCCIFS